jgi:hypothetical protein
MVTRFAPSPTGYLHIGHVVNAIYVWRTAREAGGRVLLRIEDHDRVRCRPEYEVAILEDLEWLGFEPDEGVRPLLRQSDRAHLYEEALVRLGTTHHVYACDCSRKQIGGDGMTAVAESGDLRTNMDAASAYVSSRDLKFSKICCLVRSSKGRPISAATSFFATGTDSGRTNSRRLSTTCSKGLLTSSGARTSSAQPRVSFDSPACLVAGILPFIFITRSS